MRLFTTIAIAVFSLVALIHLHRLLFDWEVIAAGWMVPRWLSAIVFLIAAVLAGMLWKESRCKH